MSLEKNYRNFEPNKLKNMTPKIHYIVRHAELISNNEGEFDVKIFTNKAFHHDEPIHARNEAFSYYEKYQAGIDEYRKIYSPEKANSKEVESVPVADDTETKDAVGEDGIIRLEDLMTKSIFSPAHEWITSNHEKSDIITPHGDAVVIMVRDDSLIDIDAGDDNPELIIHRTIKPSDETFEVDYIMWNLDTEYKIYQQYGYKTADLTTKFYYWMSEPYFEGFEDEDWVKWYTILKTPFDWTPYEKENWWGDPEFLERLVDKKINEINRSRFNQHRELIECGEGKTTEFKTLLFSHVSTTNREGMKSIRNMQLEIAETICSFLNTHGGNIYIGVKDNGQITGVDMENRTRDQYKRSFTKLKEDYFRHHPNVVYHLVTGDFIEVNGIELFLIRVNESTEPIFLFNKEKPFGTAYQFFVRQEASTNLLYDPPRLVNYIEEKWWRNKYTHYEK